MCVTKTSSIWLLGVGLLCLANLSNFAFADINQSGDIVVIDDLTRIGNSASASIDIFNNETNGLLPTATLGNQASGNGSITIRQGSTAAVQGFTLTPTDSEFALWVGFAGTGDLSVIEGSTLSGLRAMPVGNLPGSFGQVLIDGAGSQINMAGHLVEDFNALAIGFIPANSQAYMGVGSSGEGVVNVQNGGTLNLTQVAGKPTIPFGLGITLGGENTNAGGGNGTLNVAGNGSQVNITGDNAFITAGNLGGQNFDVGGHGEVHVTDGGQITIGGGSFFTTEFFAVGPFALSDDPNDISTGLAVVDGAGSYIDGGDTIGVGTNGTLFDFDPNNDIAGGTGTLIVRNGGTVESDFGVFVGPNGIVQGDGTIIGGLTVDGGLVEPGNSPGDLQVVGNVAFNGGGKLSIELDDNGVMDRLLATGTITFNDAEIQFVFGDNVDPLTLEALDIGDIFKIIAFLGDPNPQSAVSGANLLGLDTVQFSGASSAYSSIIIDFDPTSGFAVVATPVPLPGSIFLLLPALAWVKHVARRSRRVGV